MWNHPQWEDRDNLASWKEANNVQNRIIDRSNSNWNANWYTDPIRFKRQMGYMPPKITLTDSLGNKLWTQDGTTQHWRTLAPPWELKDTSGNNKGPVADIYYYYSHPAGQLLVPTDDAIIEGGEKETDDKFKNTRRITTYAEYPAPSDYDNWGFKWRRSAAKSPDHFYSVVTDGNWKKQNAGGDGNNSIAWDYKAWSNNETATRDNDDYYYFRTTEALDRYMYTEDGEGKLDGSNDIARNNNWGKVNVDISAEPIKVNVEYKDGCDIEEEGYVKPTEGSISGIPDTDTSGYNVETNRTVLISSRIPQSGEEGINFDHWELWVGGERIEMDGKPVTYTTSESVSITDALEAALYGKLNLTSDTVTVTLKAVWKQTEAASDVNYDVDFWIPENVAKVVLGENYDGNDNNTLNKGEKTWYNIRHDEHQIVDGGKVVADLYSDREKKELSTHVKETLNGEWKSGAPDFTKGGIFEYTVMTGDGYTPETATWTIETAKKQQNVNIFLDADTTMDIKVIKKWGEDEDASAPEDAEVTIQLYQKKIGDGEYAKVQKGGNDVGIDLTQSNQWKHTFEDLPMYDGDSNLITYAAFEMDNNNKVEIGGEITIKGTKYVVGYTNNDINGESNDRAITVTNTANSGTLVVKKIVEGDGGEKNKNFKFTVSLKDSSEKDLSGTYGDVKVENGKGEFSLKDGGIATLTGIPVGATYEVTEEKVTGYTTKIEGEAEGTIQQGITSNVTFTNNRGTGTLVVEKKTTAGGDIEKAFNFKVTLNEQLNGEYGEMKFKEGVAEFTLKPGEQKTAKLPEGIEYDVKEIEEGQNNYLTTYKNETGTIKANEVATATCTNTYVGKTNITVKKVWNDGNNQDGIRPDTITLGVYNGEILMGTQQLEGNKANNELTTTFTNLPEYMDGEKITYTVKEIDVPEGYNSTVSNMANQFTVTNTHTPGKTNVTAEKVWDTGDGKAPDGAKVTLQLMKKVGEDSDEIKVEGKQVTLDGSQDKNGETEDWKCTWNNLPEKENGKAITYSVKELDDGENPITDGGDAKIGDRDYVVKYGKKEDGTYTVTNTAKYTIKFTAGENGSLVGGDKTKTFTNGNVFPDRPEYSENPGYEFAGWYKRLENGTEKLVDEFPGKVTEDATYVAKFKPRSDLSYTVEYYKDVVNDEKEHFLGSCEVKNATFGEEITLKTGKEEGQLDYKKPAEGYQSGKQQGDGPYTIDKVEGNVINVLYEPLPNPHKEVVVNDDYHATETTALPGDILTYTISWTSDQNDAKDVTITDKIPTNTTLVENSIKGDNGEYNENTETITWTWKGVKNDETITASFKVKVNDGVDDVEIKNKASATFTDVGGGETPVTTTTNEVITTVPEKHTVTFNVGDNGTWDGGGEDDETEEVYDGQKVTNVPTVKPDSGYEFTNWLGDDGNTYSSDRIKQMAITKDIIFTAQYEKEEEPPTPGPTNYTVTFKVGDNGTWQGGGVDNKNVTVKPGEKVGQDKVPTVNPNDKYTFTGWKDSDGKTYTSEEIANMPITGNMTFTAQYSTTVDPTEPTDPDQPIDPTDPSEPAPTDPSGPTGQPGGVTESNPPGDNGSGKEPANTGGGVKPDKAAGTDPSASSEAKAKTADNQEAGGLPQTGQNWWLILVLMLAGIGLITAGAVMEARRRKRIAAKK